MFVDSHIKTYRISVFILILTIFSYVFLYWEAFLDLVRHWEMREEYSHGYFIPFVSLYFIWKKKQTLLNTPFHSSWSGFALVFVSLILYFLGRVSVLYILIEYSLIMVLVGLCWSIIGWQALKLIIVPLMMLAFTIPLPEYINVLLSSKLQLLSSILGVEFIVWCKIPVFLDGNVIDLGDVKIQVVEACSGLRYLFPLMSIGFICAYMFQSVLWKRILVFLSSIPITIFMNSFRIGLVGLLVDRWGLEFAEGFLHHIGGWVIFMASLALLILEMVLLAKLNKESLTGIFSANCQSDLINKCQNGENPPFFAKYQFELPFFLCFLAMIVAGLLLVGMEHREEIIPERQLFNNFPMHINSWQGSRFSLDEKTLDVLNLTDYILTDYSDSIDKKTTFYAAYYESQRRNVVPHSPKVCIPSGGWEIAEIDRKKINGFTVNKMLIQKGLDKSLVFYWYQQRGQVLANEYMMKWSLFKDALILNRTDGALVRLNTKIYIGESIEDAEKRLTDLSLNILPLLGKYIPV